MKKVRFVSLAFRSKGRRGKGGVELELLRSRLHVTSAPVFPLTWLVRDPFLSADDVQEPPGDEKDAPQVLFSGESVAPSFTGSLEVGRRMGTTRSLTAGSPVGPFRTGACVEAYLCLSGPISPLAGVAPHSAQSQHQPCLFFSCWDSPFSLLLFHFSSSSSSFFFPESSYDSPTFHFVLPFCQSQLDFSSHRSSKCPFLLLVRPSLLSPLISPRLTVWSPVGFTSALHPASLLPSTSCGSS